MLPDVSNTPPYFDDDWNDSQPVQLFFDNEWVEYSFPLPIDDDNDDVMIEVNMDEIDQIAVWDETNKKMYFKLIEETQTGLARASVVLSDGSIEVEYFLYVFVNEPSEDEPPIDEDEEE